ncbi:MAG: hypothetical protein Q9N62_06515 [Ghiorsea sp.]|nr:hypothetical protein [Ghiorsea sp.]
MVARHVIQKSCPILRPSLLRADHMKHDTYITLVIGAANKRVGTLSNHDTFNRLEVKKAQSNR